MHMYYVCVGGRVPIWPTARHECPEPWENASSQTVIVNKSSYKVDKHDARESWRWWRWWWRGPTPFVGRRSAQQQGRRRHQICVTPVPLGCSTVPRCPAAAATAAALLRAWRPLIPALALFLFSSAPLTVVPLVGRLAVCFCPLSAPLLAGPKPALFSSCGAAVAPFSCSTVQCRYSASCQALHSGAACWMARRATICPRRLVGTRPAVCVGPAAGAAASNGRAPHEGAVT